MLLVQHFFSPTKESGSLVLDCSNTELPSLKSKINPNLLWPLDYDMIRGERNTSIYWMKVRNDGIN